MSRAVCGWSRLALAEGGGAWNMSLDEALLESAAGPMLRFYRWRRPTASIGYRQVEPDWLGRAADLGMDVVRRCSGGGTVLHAGDLTYAVVVPRGCPEVPEGLAGSYDWIRSRLIDGLQRAGLAVAASRAGPGADRAPLCFAGATGNEIDLEARKLVGSAQRRTAWGLLQHGSIRLHDDRGLYRQLTGSEPGPPAELACVDGARVADGIVAAFESAIGGPVAERPLLAPERARAEWREARRSAAPLTLPSLSRSVTCADTLP
ncbi:MAG: lipoate--protein ligase family protein [Deltaproteobacteria bacterium]|nr:lipoate--protein ligase family protein [Deltaproteobacteria bacterium]